MNASGTSGALQQAQAFRSSSSLSRAVKMLGSPFFLDRITDFNSFFCLSQLPLFSCLVKNLRLSWTFCGSDQAGGWVRGGSKYEDSTAHWSLTSQRIDAIAHRLLRTLYQRAQACSGILILPDNYCQWGGCGWGTERAWLHLLHSPGRGVSWESSCTNAALQVLSIRCQCNPRS